MYFPLKVKLYRKGLYEILCNYLEYRVKASLDVYVKSRTITEMYNVRKSTV